VFALLTLYGDVDSLFPTEQSLVHIDEMVTRVRIRVTKKLRRLLAHVFRS
jgi:hypothetical protein